MTALPAPDGTTPAAPLIEVRDLAKSFEVSSPWLERVLTREPRRFLRAVDDVTFDIARGETLALVGESGCGKSTVARLLVGLHPPDAGSMRFDGVDLPRTLNSPRAGALRRRLQMIFQDPYASLNPRWRVRAIVAEPLVAQDLIVDRKALAARVAELLTQVGLAPEDGDKYPHEFSGGQRQRISIARALSSNPEFLVCDEPTSALDVSVQAQILNLMKDLQNRLGLTYLFISHNLAVVAHIATRVGVMYLGRLVEINDARQLFEQPRHPYTRMLIDAIPDLQMTGKARVPVAGEVPNPLDPPAGCAFHPRCPHTNEQCRQESPALLTLSLGGAAACHAVADGRLASRSVAMPA